MEFHVTGLFPVIDFVKDFIQFFLAQFFALHEIGEETAQRTLKENIAGFLHKSIDVFFAREQRTKQVRLAPALRRDYSLAGKYLHHGQHRCV